MLVQGFIEIRKKNTIALGLIEESRLFQLNREWELNKKNLLKYFETIGQMKDGAIKQHNQMLIKWIQDNFPFDTTNLIYAGESFNARDIFEKLINQTSDYNKQYNWWASRLYPKNNTDYPLYNASCTLVDTIQRNAEYCNYHNTIKESYPIPVITDSKYRLLLGNVSDDYWNLMKYIITYNRYSIEHWLNKSSITSEQAKYF
jgi:hypothetical protein